MPITYRTIPPLSEKDISRFWKHVDVRGEDECWPWTGSTNEHGYGQFNVGQFPFKANRVSYLIANGECPDLDILHRCDNPPCCNPTHLFPGTHADNSKDMVSKGRQFKGEAKSLVMKRVVRRGDNHPWRLHPELVRRNEDHPSSKLTNIQTEEIRERYRSTQDTQTDLAQRFNVSHSTISSIVRGKRRGGADGTTPPKKARGESNGVAVLSDNLVRQIRTRSRDGESGRSIARLLGISKTTVYRVVHRKTWAHV